MAAENQSLELMLQQRDEMVWASPEWFAALENAIAYLLANNFQQLVQILYRIDVSETKMKEQLANHQGVRTETIVAQMIVDRMLQSLQSRKNQPPQHKPVDDEEKW